MNDDDHGAFANMWMFHDLRVLISDWTRLTLVADVLQRHGASVERLSLHAQSDGCAVQCRVERLTPAAARDAIADIRRLDGTLSVSVEHLLLRHEGSTPCTGGVSTSWPN
ncbi:MAG: hypothetical protein ABL996_04805 [Micropepsaceae bacterium]